MRKKLFVMLCGMAIAASVLALVPDDAAASSRGAGIRNEVGGPGVRTAGRRHVHSAVHNAFAADVAAVSAAPTWISYSNYDSCWTPGLGAAWLNLCWH